MSYPLQFISMYINPSGNMAASGYFDSHYTQILANMYPEWHGIRLNRNSIGQQWLSANALILDKLNRENLEDLDNKFINLAHVDEVDVLYRLKIPSPISLLGGGSVTCYTAPSGITPVGYPFTTGTATPYNNIKVEERFDIEDFYYGVLPTRMTADFETTYSTWLESDEGFEFHPVPSGIDDPFLKYITPDKRVHDVTWCHSVVGGRTVFRKQDKESLGDYNIYYTSASGAPLGMTIYRDMIWWVGNIAPSGYCINLDSIKTREGQTYLDRMATYDITNQLTNGFVPSGIAIDVQGYVWLSDDNVYKLCKVTPRYDYFLVDKDNRYIYFKEDYSDPGVFVRPN